MICYRDMTFCTYYQDCGFQCERALTSILQNAIESQPDALPIMKFTESPYEEKKDYCPHKIIPTYFSTGLLGVNEE